jgi:hypothetical protein
MKYVFTPSTKAFPDSKIMRTIDVEVADFDGSVRAAINGKTISTSTLMHAVAFAIKQRLSNSFVNAATAKNDDGGLLPQKDREALWQSSFDKVLAKITDPDASPNWESVFTEGGGPVDPFLAEVSRIVSAELRAWAAKKAKKLPKVATDEYKAIADKYLAHGDNKVRIETEARRRLAEVAAIELDDDEIDFTSLSD